MKIRTLFRSGLACVVISACNPGQAGSPGGSEITSSALSVEGPSGRSDEGKDNDSERCGLPAGLGALPGFKVRIWAKGTATFSHPDAIERDGKDIWVGYQNVTAKDGTDGKSSTVVEYNLHGHVENTYTVPGHCDGLRIDPATHLVWASSNEDGNPGLVSIDPATGTVTPFTFDPTPHGGGFDDMAFLNGKMFIAASNPTLDASGVNVFPAVDQVTFQGTHVVLTPVLQGNGSAVDITSGTAVTLNEIDPDSLSIDPAGDLVLTNQAGSELVFISNPGSASQVVTRLAVATQLEDPTWATSADGEFLIVDGTTNMIYSVKGPFVPGTAYTETPDDSSIASMFGTVNLKTGVVSPLIIGFTKATGLLFLPPDVE
jgi:hypothetical protein